MFSPESFFTPTVWCVPLLSVLYEVLLVCFHNLLIRNHLFLSIKPSRIPLESRYEKVSYN